MNDSGEALNEEEDAAAPDSGAGFAFSFTVSAEQTGQRVDRFLCECLPAFSRSRLQALIKEGAVTVNGRAVKPSSETSAGETVAGAVPPDRPAAAQPQDIPLDVIYEDAHLAIINKASGMVVHPAHGNLDGTLVNALLHRFGNMSSIGGVQRPGIVHRLDKETSGCLVVARNDATHQRLTEQFAARTMTKIYLAVAQGRPESASGSVKTHIGRDPHDRLRMTVVREPAGKFAHTDYETLYSIADGSLVQCTLHTGRTHQIRVHLKHLGHPLLGDELYSRTARQARVPRLMLHAWQLGFLHPGTGREVRFEAPVPPEFRFWMPPQQGPSRPCSSDLDPLQ